MIRISRLADYGSLLLAPLVTCTDAPIHTARDLADQCRLPYPTVSKILKVLVSEGDEVSAGQGLLVMEAMKMEHSLKADCDGKVEALDLSPGSQVKRQQLLVTVTPDAAE